MENVIDIRSAKAHESYRLTWVGPVISQHEMEGLFQWVNLHLTSLNLRPLISFSKIKTSLVSDPEEALKFEFDIVSLGHPHSIELFKEAVWSELFAASHPTPQPYAVSFLPLEVINSTKRLIAFDMDSTLINQEVIDEIARTVGFYDQVAELTELAMQGKIDFVTSFKKRIQLFKGMPKAQAASIIPTLTLSPGSEKIISHFRFKDAKTAIVSGGFEFILKHFQKQLFIDQVYGTVLETDDEECFTGEVNGPIVDAAFKQNTIARLKENYQIDKNETIVVGDGANDIPMMQEAGVSVSFCGKPKLSAVTNTLILNRNLFWIKEVI